MLRFALLFALVLATTPAQAQVEAWRSLNELAGTGEV